MDVLIAVNIKTEVADGTKITLFLPNLIKINVYYELETFWLWIKPFVAKGQSTLSEKPTITPISTIPDATAHFRPGFKVYLSTYRIERTFS